MKKNLLIALLAISALSAGCGGDDEKKSGGSSNAPAPVAAPAAAPVAASEDLGAASAAQELIDSVNSRYEEELAAANSYGLGKHSEADRDAFREVSPDNFRFDGGCVLSSDINTLMEVREVNGKKVTFANSIKEFCKIREVSKSDCAKAVRLAQSIPAQTKKLLTTCAKKEQNSKANFTAFGDAKGSTKLVQTIVQIRDALEGLSSDEVSEYSGSVSEDKPKTSSSAKKVKTDIAAVKTEVGSIAPQASALSEDVVNYGKRSDLAAQYQIQIEYKDQKGFSREEFRKRDPGNFRFDGGCELAKKIMPFTSASIAGQSIDLVKSTVAACIRNSLSDSSCKSAVELAQKIQSGAKTIAGSKGCAKTNDAFGAKEGSISLAKSILDYSKLF